MNTGLPRHLACDGGYPIAEAQLGALKPRTGEVQLRGGGTGHGKSCDAVTLVPMLARRGVVLYAHTEESTSALVGRLGAGRGGRNSDVAGNIRIKDVRSLRDVAVMVYKAVETAVRTDRELPVALVVDTVNHLDAGGDLRMRHGSQAELLSAVANLDLEKIGQLVELTYADWAKKPTPQLEGSMAVVAYTITARSDQSFATALLVGADTAVRFERDKPSGNPVIDHIDETGVNRRGFQDTGGKITVVKARRGPGTGEARMQFDYDAGINWATWSDI